MTVDQWAAGVGFLMPVLVSIVNRAEWSSWLKAVVSMLSAVVAGTVTALIGGDFNGTNWLQAIGIVFAVSQGSYHTWWKGSKISDSIERGINIIAAAKSKQPALGGSPGDSLSVDPREEWGPYRDGPAR